MRTGGTGLGLADFSGHWRLSRRIEAGSASTATLDGTAKFAGSARGLEYLEAGMLRIAGQNPVAAERRAIWVLAGSAISVLFADGRAFHRFDGADPEPVVRHDCAPDLYLGQYDFRDWPDWSLTWQVSGPHKAYRTVSTFRRT